MREGEWRMNQKIGSIYKITPDDLNRVGNCWAEGRLKSGDLLLCVNYAGDCYCDYVLIAEKVYSDGTKIKKMVTEKIGAYDLGIEVFHLPEMEFYGVMRGEEVPLLATYRVDSSKGNRR